MAARRGTTMRIPIPLVLLVAAAALTMAADSPAQAPARSPSPAVAASPAMPSGGPGTPGGPGAAGAPSGTPPPYAAENDRYIADVQKAIQGKEDLPSKEVFKNVKMLGDVPASRLLRTMQAFTRSLGVSCTKCHVPEHFDS